MNVIEAIYKRHSYRGKYLSIPVSRSDLVKIMEAGMAAPSGCNKQTAGFIAVDDPDVLKKINEVINPPVCFCFLVGVGWRPDRRNQRHVLR